MSQDPTNENINEEIDLVEIFHALLKGKWIIFVSVFFFSAISVYIALNLPNMYRSYAVLAPVDKSESGALSSLAGQFGGLAAIAGVNLGGGANKTSEALEILQSWSFIEGFIEENKIEADVFAVEDWESTESKLIYNNDIYNPSNDSWNIESPRSDQGKPSSWMLYEKFKDNYLIISEDKGTGFITLSIEYYSPEIAKIWVEKLVKRINFFIRDQDLSLTKKNLEFLKTQISETSLASMQNMLYALIEEQTKNFMLAQSSGEYVFKTINEPRAAEYKSKPNRFLICVLGAFLGLLLGCLVALVTFFVKPSNKIGK